jgi:diadenosine tetraphosphate (Ap4A) HIT family hydrolase
MDKFQLDTQLEEDCFIMGCLGNSMLLLLNNAQVPWFILVPKTDIQEIYELGESTQADLFAAINQLSQFIKAEFTVDKLNIAAIGNVVSQLHIHAVGRNKNDYCWPGVVWGADGSVPYKADEVEKIRRLLEQKLGGEYHSG